MTPVICALPCQALASDAQRRVPDPDPVVGAFTDRSRAPEIIAEDDGWTVLLPGHPVAADGMTLDDALRDFVSALRDYADAWDDRLHRAPNHQHAAALVQHVFVSEDDQLLAWARGPTTSPRWQQVPSTRLDTYELDLPDGRVLRTRISRPPNEATYGARMWAHILRDQLDVTADEFWTCVRDGVAPNRTPDDVREEADDAIPVDVVNLLVGRVGLTRRDLVGMTREEAIARLNEYWTTGR